tara:strand:- start:620 stop:1321 length:702 start_codon:yes stop_codon:yes gene_type:complete
MSEFKTYNLFPLTIYKSKIELDMLEKESLENEIFLMEKNTKNQDYKTHNKAWTGDTQGFANLHHNKKFENLFNQIKVHIQNYLEKLHIDTKQTNIYYQRAWATISRGLENISPHIHAQSHVSFAYYLKKSSSESKILFLDQNKNNEIIPGLFSSKSINKKNIIKERDEHNTSAITFDVEEDDIVIFPSKTLHSTQANIKNDLRISLSADITILAKDSENLEHLIPAFKDWKKF